MSERDDRPADGTLDGESRYESAENAAEAVTQERSERSTVRQRRAVWALSAGASATA